MPREVMAGNAVRSCVLVITCFVVSLQPAASEESWTLASECFEWSATEKVLSSIAPISSDNDCDDQNRDDLRFKFSQALSAGRAELLSRNQGVCERQERSFRPAAGHYVVWRNYRTDLWFRFASTEDDGTEEFEARRERLESMLGSHLSKETLSCAFPGGRYKPRTFYYSTDGQKVLQIGLSLGNDDDSGTGVDEAEMEAYREQLDRLKGASQTEFTESSASDRIGDERSDAAEERAEEKSPSVRSSDAVGSETSTAPSEGSQGTAASPNGDGDGSAATEGNGEGVLPPAAPPWIADLAQMILANYGLDQYAQFGALALMALAPDVLNELAAFSAELTAGLNSDDLNLVMGALREAYKIGSMLNSLSQGYEAIANASDDSFEAALVEATKQIRDMPPELRKELSDELGGDFENLQKYSALLNPEDLASISDVIDDPDKMEGLLDRLTDRVVAKVEETAVTEALKQLDSSIPAELAVGLYRGAIEQNAERLGAAILEQVGPELGLSEADISALARGELESVARNQVEARLTSTVDDALKSIGLSPGATAFAAMVATAEVPSAALLDVALSALPQEISGPAQALLKGDSQQALKDLAASRIGTGPAADAARALLEGEEVNVAAQEAIVAKIRAEIGDDVPLPEDLSFETLPEDVATALARKGGEAAQIGFAALSGDTEELERLGKEAIADVLPDDPAIDAQIVAAAVALLSPPVTADERRDRQPLTDALSDENTSVAKLASIAAAPQFAEPLRDLREIFEAASWQHEFAAALETGDASRLRVAAIGYSAETNTLTHVSEGLAKSALATAIGENQGVQELLGEDAADFTNALLAGDSDRLFSASERRVNVLHDNLEGARANVEVLVQLGAMDQVKELAGQLIDPRAAEVLASEDPAKSMILLASNELGGAEGDVLKAFFEEGPEAAISVAADELPHILGRHGFSLLVSRNDPAEVGAELIRETFQIRFGPEARALVPDLLDARGAPVQALTEMAALRRLELAETLGTQDTGVRNILSSWPDEESRTDSIFAWAAEDITNRGIEIEAAVLRHLAKVWDDGSPFPGDAVGARTYQAAALALSTTVGGGRSKPLRDAIVAGNAGKALRLARATDGFSATLTEASASAALQNAAANSPLAAPLADIGVDPYLLMTSDMARKEAVAAIERLAQGEVTRLEAEAANALAELYLMATDPNPLALAVDRLPEPLRPIARALLEQEALVPAIRTAAKTALRPQLGDALAELVFDDEYTSQLFGARDATVTVNAAVAIAERLSPGTLQPTTLSLEEIADLAETNPDTLIALVEKAKDAQGPEREVVLALVAAALSDTPLNRAYLTSAVEAHVGEGLGQNGVAPEVLAATNLRTNLARAASKGSPVLQRLSAIGPPMELQTAIQSLEDPAFDAVAEALESLGSPLDTLLLARSGQLAAAWSRSLPEDGNSAVMHLSVLLIAQAIDQSRTAQLVFGDKTAALLRETLETGGLDDLEGILGSILSTSVEDIGRRAGVETGRTVWPGLQRALDADGVSAMTMDALEAAVFDGVPVPTHLRVESEAALSRQGLGRAERVALIEQGDPQVLVMSGFGALTQASGSQHVSIDPSASATATLRELIEPILRAQLAASSNQREFIRFGAPASCYDNSDCLSTAAALIQPPLTEAEAKDWLRLRDSDREELAASILTRLLCPNADVTCRWNTSASAQQALIRLTTSAQTSSPQDADDLLEGRSVRVAERNAEKLRVQTKASLAEATTDVTGQADTTRADTIDGALAVVRQDGEARAPELNQAELASTFDARLARMRAYEDRAEAIKSCVSLGLGTEEACVACTADPEYLESRGTRETATCTTD